MSATGYIVTVEVFIPMDEAKDWKRMGREAERPDATKKDGASDAVQVLVEGAGYGCEIKNVRKY